MSHVADCAISLGWLLAFARNVPDGYTTADVVQKIVIPATKNYACRYVELPSVPKAAVGPVRFFISHRWAADFTQELVSLVASHFADSVVEGPGVLRGPCPLVVTRNAGAVRPGAGVPAADASFSGIEVDRSNRIPLQRSRPPRGLLSSLNPHCRSSQDDDPPRQPQVFMQSQPRYQPPLIPMPSQHQQQSTTEGCGRVLGRCLINNDSRYSCRSSLGSARPPAPGQGAAAAPKHCTGPPQHLPSYSSVAAVPIATAVATCGVAVGALSNSASHSFLQGLSGSSVSRSSSARLRAGREALQSAGGDGSGVGGGVHCGGGAESVVLRRPSPSSITVGASSGGGLEATAEASQCESSYVGAATTVVLPGAPIGGDADDAEGFRLGGGGSSFSGSLNPLHARPSAVTHHWPYQQFNSVCSRYSSCSVGNGGGGGSFCRQASAPGPAEPGGPGSGCRSDVPPMPQLPPVAAGSSTAELGGCGGRSTVTGVVSYLGSRGPSRMGSAKEPAAVGRRASSASGCRQGELYGSRGGAATDIAAGVTSRASEASDAAAVDPVAASSSSGSSCSRNSGRSSSGGGGGSRAAASRVSSNVDVVDRLLGRFVGREEDLQGTFVWLDVFAINQHADAREGQQAKDLSQLHEVVERSQETLLVLDQGGLVLTRIWCLYEIWHTVRRKGPEGLRVLAGPLEFTELAHVWGELDVERAQATFPADRDRILADIHTTTGARELNRAIQQALVKSASLDLDAARAAAPRTPHHGERAFRAAFLQRTAGCGGVALAAAREAADVFCECWGPAHPDTLRALRAVAGCHKDLGAARQAVGLLEQQVVPYMEEAYGPCSTESGALDELGMLYYTLGQYDMAYDMLLTALCLRLRQLELVAPSAVAAPQLAAALSLPPCTTALAAAATAGRGGAAAGDGADGGDGVVPPLEPLCGAHLTAVLTAVRHLVSELAEAEQAKATRRAEEIAAAAATAPQGGGGAASGVVLTGPAGSSVELAGLSLHCLGLVQRERAQRCRSSDSVPLLREARELMEASVELLRLSSSAARGLAASDARANLAALAMDGGDVAAAEAMLRENLAATEAVYGRDHPHVATAANNLALCLKRQLQSCPDKASEALALYRRCLESCGRGLGEAHPETLMVAANMGVLLADLRQWSEAEQLLTRAIAALPPQPPCQPPSQSQPQLRRGREHLLDVLMAHRRLAEVLECRNKLFEAEAVFRLALQWAEEVPPEARDHGLVLEVREGLARVQERLEEMVAEAVRDQGSPGCCVVS